jgi:hypothetical protein
MLAIIRYFLCGVKRVDMMVRWFGISYSGGGSSHTSSTRSSSGDSSSSGSRECLLLFGAESFVFQFAIQKVKDR